MNRFDHDFSQISNCLNIHTVKSVHNVHDIVLIYDDRHSDVADLFKIRPNDYGIRNMRQIREFTFKYNPAYHSPVTRIRRSLNLLNLNLADYDGVLYQFKSDIKSRSLSYYTNPYL